jgi:hypothetical protein
MFSNLVDSILATFLPLAACEGADMHVHGNPMTSNGANLHSAAAAEKAASAQRARETRKKLIKTGEGAGWGTDDELNPEAGLMVGRWTEGGSPDGRRQERGDRPAKPQTADEEPASRPVSVWA